MGGVGEDQSQTGRQRLTVAEASEVLGITVEAVRGRIKRGTLDHERTEKGVFVFLQADQSTDRPRPDNDQTADRLQSEGAALISAKDETIATLRDQLEAERQAHAEARRLLAAALERIPAIEAPSEARESPETPSEPRPSTTRSPESGDACRGAPVVAEDVRGVDYVGCRDEGTVEMVRVQFASRLITNNHQRFDVLDTKTSSRMVIAVY
jgi:hypothetical protein